MKMGLWGQAVGLLAVATTQPRITGPGRWLGEPRNAVLVVLALAIVIGVGRKLLQGWRARAAVARLNDPKVTPDDVLAVVAHGRAGLIDLFRLLGTAGSEPIRDAAGNALAALWARDELIAEEEKALVRRGFVASWHARRRFPRALHTAIPISVSYGVSFLRDRPGEVGPANLEWSHKIVGARRAALESFSPWKPGPGVAEFTLIPGDFDTNGPHRLVLHSRVRTIGLTDSWQIELPQIPFHLEFDPILEVNALFALADDARGEAIARAVQFVNPEPDETRAPVYIALNSEMALRDPPALVLTTPLPCDLAHRLEIELEGIAGRTSAGAILLSGQGLARGIPESRRAFPLSRLAPLAADAIDHPGPRRLRAILTPDPDLGWSDPDVRSIWHGSITTGWVEVQIVRR